MQKSARKNSKYSRNETILKIGHLAKAIAHAKTIAFAKWSVWVKNQKCKKTGEKPFYENIRVVLCKKVLEKTANIREMKRFLKSAICKGYSPCKGYSLFKMVSLGQKLKMQKTCEKPFYENIRVVVWKKLLEKTANIREMKRLSKSAI